MAVLMIAEVPNLTEEIYAGMVDQMRPLMQASPGFLSHTGGPNPTGGWRVVEVWESEADGKKWFDERQTQPSTGHRPRPPVLPAPHRLHEVAVRTGTRRTTIRPGAAAGS